MEESVQEVQRAPWPKTAPSSQLEPSPSFLSCPGPKRARLPIVLERRRHMPETHACPCMTSTHHPHATHTPPTRHPHAIHTPPTCHPHATHMPSMCHSRHPHATHTSPTSPTHHPLPSTCHLHITHMPPTRHPHTIHPSPTCHPHTIHTHWFTPVHTHRRHHRPEVSKRPLVTQVDSLQNLHGSEPH